MPEGDEQREDTALVQAVTGKTASRQVLGSMNDFVWMLDSYLAHHETLLDVSLHLAKTPCGPLRMSTPQDETIRAFRVQA